jgi:hypothetical protein
MRCEECDCEIGFSPEDHRETPIGKFCAACFEALKIQEDLLDAIDEQDDFDEGAMDRWNLGFMGV